MTMLLAASMLILTSFFSTVSSAQQQAVVSVGDAYAPVRFNAASDVFIVVDGVFPNACYHWSHADVQSPSQFVHEIRAVADVNDGMCLMMLVPFSNEVHLGTLDAGDQKILLVNSDGSHFELNLKIDE